MATRKGPEDRFRKSDQPYDWQRFWIHFVCGALIGALIGFGFWFRNWEPGLSVWRSIFVPSTVLALLGGIFGDRFWEGFLRLVGRLGWWV